MEDAFLKMLREPPPPSHPMYSESLVILIEDLNGVDDEGMRDMVSTLCDGVEINPNALYRAVTVAVQKEYHTTVEHLLRQHGAHSFSQNQIENLFGIAILQHITTEECRMIYSLQEHLHCSPRAAARVCETGIAAVVALGRRIGRKAHDKIWHSTRMAVLSILDVASVRYLSAFIAKRKACAVLERWKKGRAVGGD